jgi:hypothetical protein
MTNDEYVLHLSENYYIRKEVSDRPPPFIHQQKQRKLKLSLPLALACSNPNL